MLTIENEKLKEIILIGPLSENRMVTLDEKNGISLFENGNLIHYVEHNLHHNTLKMSMSTGCWQFANFNHIRPVCLLIIDAHTIATAHRFVGDESYICKWHIDELGRFKMGKVILQEGEICSLQLNKDRDMVVGVNLERRSHGWDTSVKIFDKKYLTEKAKFNIHKVLNIDTSVKGRHSYHDRHKISNISILPDERIVISSTNQNHHSDARTFIWEPVENTHTVISHPEHEYVASLQAIDNEKLIFTRHNGDLRLLGISSLQVTPQGNLGNHTGGVLQRNGGAGLIDQFKLSPQGQYYYVNINPHYSVGLRRPKLIINKLDGLKNHKEFEKDCKIILNKCVYFLENNNEAWIQISDTCLVKIDLLKLQYLPEKDSSCLLHYAVNIHTAKEHYDLLTSLVKYFDNYISVLTQDEVVDHENNTALHLAVKYNDIKLVELLISLKEDLLLKKNSQGKTPYEIAVESKDVELTKFLKKQPLVIRHNLYMACQKGNLLEIDEAIELGADINTEVEEGISLLHQTILTNSLSAAYLLKNKKCNPQSVLTRMAIEGQLRESRIVTFILEHMDKSDPKAEILCSIYKKLLEINPNNKTEYHDEIIQKILNTILRQAVRHDDLDLADFAIKAGAQVNVQNKYLNTPLHSAYKHGHRYMQMYLMFKGADSDLYNCQGHKPKEREKKSSKSTDEIPKLEMN